MFRSKILATLVFLSCLVIYAHLFTPEHKIMFAQIELVPSSIRALKTWLTEKYVSQC